MKKRISLLINNNVSNVPELLNSKGARRAYQFHSDIFAMIFQTRRDALNPPSERYPEKDLLHFFEIGYTQYNDLRSALDECVRVSVEMYAECFPGDYKAICLEIIFYMIGCKKPAHGIKVNFGVMDGRSGGIMYW